MGKKLKGSTTIAIYGVTNLGKTTQIGLLEQKAKELGFAFAYVKYPVYDLKPTGPRINAFLREDNPEKLSPLDFQKLQVKNREDYEPTLLRLREENDIVVLEMYTGTGITYGMGDDVDKKLLIDLNDHLYKPDVSILLDGNRFMKSVEKNHRYETDHQKTGRIKGYHLELAKDFGWKVVVSHRSEEEVFADIWGEICSHMPELEKVES